MTLLFFCTPTPSEMGSTLNRKTLLYCTPKPSENVSSLKGEKLLPFAIVLFSEGKQNSFDIFSIFFYISLTSITRTPMICLPVLIRTRF